MTSPYLLCFLPSTLRNAVVASLSRFTVSHRVRFSWIHAGPIGIATFSRGRRLPLDLGLADCTAVVLCRVVLVLALNEDECKIY